MILVLKSKNAVSIRLTSVRWTHITTSYYHGIQNFKGR